MPGFQDITLPLLRIAGDGREHSLANTRSKLAAELGLSEEDQRELLPSGRQSRFANRVAWAKVYLAQAGLLLSPKRGHFRISELGESILRDPPTRIDIKYLERFPGIVEFRKGKGESEKSPGDDPTGAGIETPEETLESAHLRINSSLAAELLERVKAVTPQFFERLVVDLLLKMGYGGARTDAGEVLGRSGDEGIDGIISEDRLGLDIVYLQAKKWEKGSVGRPEVQKFVGALHGKRAKKGVFITTSTFSDGALAYVEHIEPKVVLIDGLHLAELMIDYEVGVSTVRTYKVKRVDSDFFEEA